MHGERFLLHGMVEDAAARWPDSVAVATPRRTLTFAEVDRLADQVAATLVAAGAAREVPVGVRLPKGWEQVVAALGVLKAGLAYLPLDPDLPPRRLAQLVDLAGCRHVLTDGAVALPRARVHLISEVLRGEPPAARVGPEVDPHDLAYVLFTSGSTGVPKGVMVEHASAANTILALNRRFQVGPGDALLGVSSFSFDPSVYDLFGMLGAGATLVLPDPGLARDPAHWAGLMTEHRVTVWMSVPALLTMLVSWHCESGDEAGAPLRVAFLGGEVLQLDLPDRVRRVFGQGELVNVYGPTETSICSSYYTVEAVDPRWERIPCGKPLSGQQIVILDEDLRPVPAGGVGEICISGLGLARGYWGDEERTRLAFVRQPGTGVRLYRTGDRGRWLPDGNLDFLGRADNQIKLRGYRIELGEVEAALLRTGRVEQAAVVLTPTGLAGFVVARDPIDAAALGAEVAALLPSYMVPDSLTALDRLPLISNGKVDRAALAAQAGAVAVSTGTQPSRPGIERRLAEIVADLLQRPVPDRTERFGDLGGTSLLAAQFAARVRRLFQVDVPIAFALAHPTVAEMAEALTGLPGRPDVLPALVPRDATDVPAPLSQGQEQVWFLDQLVGGNRAYHAQCTIRFTGDIRPDLLRRALTEVVRRHEIMRTTFHDQGDGPVQVVHDPAPVPLPVTDLRDLPAPERVTALERCVREEADRSFDLQGGPLAFWRLVRSDEDDWLLIQTEHHLVHDGWSAAVLWREVGELYSAFCTGRQPRLPALPIQFSDYAEWQRRRYTGARREQARAYWRRQLDGVRPADLAVAGLRPPRQTFVGSALRVDIPAELYARLRAFSHDEGGSLFATMFAAYAVLLHRYSGEPDICVGSWLANRDHEKTENLIGMFVNMVALRSTMAPHMSFRQLVAQVRQTLQGALSYQYAPFDDVVRELDLPRDPSRNPLVQHCFSFHDSPFPDFAWPRAQGVFQERHNGSAKFDLNVVVVPRAEQRGNLAEPLRAGERLTLIWEFNTAVVSPGPAQRMLEHYLQILTAVVADPDREAARLSMVTDADLVQVAPLSDAADQESPLLAAKDVVEMFRRQVARRPEAVAVRAADGEVSYAEVDRRARALAGRLRQEGVSPGDRVAVCLPRTSALPVALLGTLMTGAAYVPLDPQHPPSRSRLVVGEAGARVVVTQPDLVEVFPRLRPVFPTATVAAADDDGRRPEPESESYVLFTSGTTGRPKGVAVPHRALTNVLQAIQHLIHLTEDDVLLAVTTVAFDIAALEYFLPLATGGCVVIASEDAVVNGERLVQLAAASGVTVMQATPMTWRIMIEVGWRPADRFISLCGGESMPADLARELADRSTACWNLYGPTETTIWSTAYRVRGDETLVPIGRPLLNTTVRILDEAGQPVPIGLPGELFIGGAGLALGYTSAALTAGPFQQGWYRTGDLVRRSPEGDLEFLGRGDRQIKLHGYRIELEEIELTLRGCAGVQDCAVELRGDRLVGYVELDTGSVPPEDLAAQLSARLPRYMVPAAFVAVPALPRSANGKLDREALAAADLPVIAAPATRSAAPVGPIEEQVATIWAEILGKRELSAEDDFFAIGGHSLMVVLMVSRIRSRMHLELDLEAVFDHPTIRGIASVLAGSEGREQ